MRSYAALNCFNLGGSSILIFFALENKGGYRDAGKKFLNVPILKIRIKPHAIPPPKGAVYVVTMIFYESFAEVFGFIGRFGLCDSLHCNVLIEYVGGERNDGFHPGVPHPTRIDQRN